MSILRVGQSNATSITLETRERRPIENRQLHEIGRYDVPESEEIKRKFRNTIKIRTGINPIYNCHGLTFASRRTGIDNLPWDMIMQDDGYTEIPVFETMPGDVVIYFGSDGSAEHSGIVLENERGKPIQMPLILSKWGSFGEVIHLANNVPEQFGSDRRYYRITK